LSKTLNLSGVCTPLNSDPLYGIIPYPTPFTSAYLTGCISCQPPKKRINGFNSSTHTPYTDILSPTIGFGILCWSSGTISVTSR
jgi:hypothetical protein